MYRKCRQLYDHPTGPFKLRRPACLLRFPFGGAAQHAARIASGRLTPYPDSHCALTVHNDISQRLGSCSQSQRLCLLSCKSDAHMQA
jgi:hypothetical protein